jgi:hypothetical protein
MGSKTFCDICNKEVDRPKSPYVSFHHGTLDLEYIYFACWADKKNWPHIHTLPQEKEND